MNDKEYKPQIPEELSMIPLGSFKGYSPFGGIEFESYIMTDYLPLLKKCIEQDEHSLRILQSTVTYVTDIQSLISTSIESFSVANSLCDSGIVSGVLKSESSSLSASFQDWWKKNEQELKMIRNGMSDFLASINGNDPNELADRKILLEDTVWYDYAITNMFRKLYAAEKALFMLYHVEEKYKVKVARTLVSMLAEVKSALDSIFNFAEARGLTVGYANESLAERFVWLTSQKGRNLLSDCKDRVTFFIDMFKALKKAYAKGRLATAFKPYTPETYALEQNKASEKVAYSIFFPDIKIPNNKQKGKIKNE